MTVNTFYANECPELPRHLNTNRIGWACLGGLLLCYTGVSLWSRFMMYDFHNFVNMAQELPRGGWVHPIYAVGYRLALRGMFEVVGDYAMAGKIISLFGSAISLYSVWRLGSLVSGSEWVGIGVMCFTAINRTFLLWGTTPNTDLIAWGFALAGTYVFLRSSLNGEDRSCGDALLSGLLLGFGFIMRYSVILVAMVTGAWFMICFVNSKCIPKMTNMLAYFLGFVAIASIQMIPAMIETGSPLTTITAKMFWLAYQWENTGISYSILYTGAYANTRPTEILSLISSHLTELTYYYFRNIATLTMLKGYRIVGPIIFAFAYPATAFALWHTARVARWRVWYLVSVASIVVLYHGLVIFAARYLLIVIPIAILFSLLLMKELLYRFWNWGAQRVLFGIPKRMILIMVVVVGLSVHVLGEIRILYLRERERPLYTIVQMALQKAGATSAQEVCSVFLTCNAYYDLDLPTKPVYDEILIHPRSSLADLRSAMLKADRTFVIVDECSRAHQPELVSAFLTTRDPPQYEKVLLYPANSPKIGIYRLTQRKTRPEGCL
jgi:hypothetical protein